MQSRRRRCHRTSTRLRGAVMEGTRRAMIIGDQPSMFGGEVLPLTRCLTDHNDRANTTYLATTPVANSRDGVGYRLVGLSFVKGPNNHGYKITKYW